jgi:hypothetical protein
MEIEVRRGTALGLIAGILLAYLGVTGYLSSPHDTAGRPVLLLPEVRAVEHYRKLVGTWVVEWRGLDKNVAGILGNDGTRLLATSQQAQQALDLATTLASQVDANEAPSAMVGLRDLSVQAAVDYADASTAAARWLSAPSSANLAAANAALSKARQDRAALEANEWLKLEEPK